LIGVSGVNLVAPSVGVQEVNAPLQPIALGYLLARHVLPVAP